VFDEDSGKPFDASSGVLSILEVIQVRGGCVNGALDGGLDLATPVDKLNGADGRLR
jgi:hypothetical protein